MIQTKPLYNVNHEHMADVKKDNQGTYHIIGVDNTLFGHVNRQGDARDVRRFQADFELFFDSELPEEQTDIFDFI